MNKAKPMTAEELQAIKDRWAKFQQLFAVGRKIITVEHNLKYVWTDGHYEPDRDEEIAEELAVVLTSDTDAAAIASAPADISALVAENERLQTEIDKLNATIRDMRRERMAIDSDY